MTAEGSNIVIFDRDDTISRKLVSFDGVGRFLEQQQREGRACVLATRGSDKHSAQEVCVPEDLVQYFSVRYGTFLISGASPIYLREDGSPGRIDVDFIHPEILMPLLEARKKWEEMGAIRGALTLQGGVPSENTEYAILDKIFQLRNYEDLIHRETRLPFSRIARPYQHPSGKIFQKDLNLLMRDLSLRYPLPLNAVMIGDEGEIQVAESNTKVPLMVVDANGDWIKRDRVSLLLQGLFEGEATPADAFDRWIARGEKLPQNPIRQLRTVEESVISVIQEKRFLLQKLREGGRLIHELKPQD
jgi:hypothetical protein